MDTGSTHILIYVINIFFIVYTLTAVGSYVILGALSLFETITYLRKNSYVDYKQILSSTVAPSISIIAPAYNESLNIVDNVRSLLSNYYANYDVTIINDGSTDNSLEKLIEAYDLECIDYLINEQIKTQALRAGVFKSTNPAFKKLTVIDKENGGKADALNVGLNISKSDYVVCIDVDCLLLEDALQKMIKPFLETTKIKVIAAGGVVRIANSCVVKNGRLLAVNFPKKLIEKTQVLEYIRAFLLSRMAWSRLNGLLIISGAFGMFDRKITIEIGGYDTSTIGEDLEIIVRMRMHMEEQNIKYKMAYIPDPLCWTEAPDNYKTFISQRNRWTRGTIETLQKHRKIGLNYKYRLLGLLSYPYWFLYERIGPVIETIGIVYLTTLVMYQKLRWDYAFVLFILAYLFTVLFSLVAILTEEHTFHQYKDKGIGYKMILTVLLEPFTLHPLILYAAIRGNWDYLFNKNKRWGTMIRKGFQKSKVNNKKIL
jgi:cellulose synthase/poly-beta-1,6-N-acetylglucosamine synthase-like glycosyltransferase